MMLQAKGWTAVVLVSLALGIGANTALFTAMNGLLFRTLPVSDPDTLVRFASAGPNQMRTDTLVYGFTAPEVLLVVATVASYVPARRAMRMAPVDALRTN